MATCDAAGIRTRYEIVGSGPPLLMFSPGGFDSSLDSWRTVGSYRRLDLVTSLAERHTLVLFDRRESGLSSGRIERVTWARYVEQAIGLLDHLGLAEVSLLGGCVGCSTAVALAVNHPSRVRSMVLYSPAGGARYRIAQHQRFAYHVGFVLEHGTAAVVELARTHEDGFSKDPRVGPWAAPLRTDTDFAASYAGLDAQHYGRMVNAMCRGLFDRDSVPGFEPEDLMALDVPALVVPGEDASHAPSAARFLFECLERGELWDVRVADQTAESASACILDFLDGPGE